MTFNCESLPSLQEFKVIFSNCPYHSFKALQLCCSEHLLCVRHYLEWELQTLVLSYIYFWTSAQMPNTTTTYKIIKRISIRKKYHMKITQKSKPEATEISFLFCFSRTYLIKTRLFLWATVVGSALGVWPIGTEILVLVNCYPCDPG